MPFKRDMVLQNIPLSKHPFRTQSQIENEDVTWSSRYDMHVTRTKQQAKGIITLQEVELGGWFLIPHIVPETCTI